MVDYEALAGGLPEVLQSAQACLRDGAFPAAIELSKKAASDCRANGDKIGEAKALLMQADIAFGSEDVLLGAKAANEALLSFQSMKDQTGEAAALTLVSTAYLRLGELQDAVEIGGDAVQQAQTSGASKLQLAFARAAVAAACVASLDAPEAPQDPELQAKALEAAQLATSGFREVGNREAMVEAICDLSRAYLFAGNHNMALAKAKEAQRVYQAMHNSAGEARSLILVSQALSREGSTDAAIQHALDAGHMYETLGDVNGQALAYDLVDKFEAARHQEKQELTLRVLKTMSSAQGDDGKTVQPHMLVPKVEKPLIEAGVCKMSFKGFMGRTAGTTSGGAAPAGGTKSSSAGNPYLLYNVSWQ